MEKKIEIFNLGNLPTAPLDSFFELQEDFKKSDPDKLSKLQMLILTRGFKYSFKVWRDPENGRLMIIDAHQRRKALLGLRKYGYEIPDIPYEEIQAATKQEAVEEIAAYNSEFAQKNPDTILFEKYKISEDTLSTNFFLQNMMPRKFRKIPLFSLFLKLKTKFLPIRGTCSCWVTTG